MINRVLNKLKQLSKIVTVRTFNVFTRAYQKHSFEKRIKDNVPSIDYSKVNTNQKRSVEIKERDFLLREVLFSCYFIMKENPQTHEIQGVADFNYIKAWYESVNKLGINAIIIHDGIDKHFIDTYETDKIQFRRFYAGNHPLIDERWITFYMFLKETYIEKVFFTDIGDVIITKSPFEWISSKNQLFIGRDNANKIGLSGWILKEIEKLSNETGEKLPKSIYFQALYNVGIVGGNRKVCLFVLSKVVEYILKSNPNTYKEMTIFNIVIHNYFFPILSYYPEEKVLVNPKNDKYSSHENIISGYPLNSLFKGYEYNSDAYFIHK
jgi:hypothetical protein